MCFPWSSIEAIIIWCIVIAAVIAIIKILFGWLGPRLAWPADIISLFVQIFSIILWTVVSIAVVIIVGDIVMCLISMAPSLNLHSR